MPTSPMSWFSGSQLTAMSPGPAPTPAGPANASMFADRLRCVSATPFGADVDPEVNWTKAMSSSDGDVIGSIGGASSSARDNTMSRAGQLDRIAANAGARAALVTTARAPELRSVAAVNSM